VSQNEWRTLRRAKIAVFVVFVAACVYNVPRFFEREVVLGTLSCSPGAELRPYVRHTTMRGNPVYFLVYKTICYFIFRSFTIAVTRMLYK